MKKNKRLNLILRGKIQTNRNKKKKREKGTYCRISVTSVFHSTPLLSVDAFSYIHNNPTQVLKNWIFSGVFLRIFISFNVSDFLNYLNSRQSFSKVEEKFKKNFGKRFFEWGVISVVKMRKMEKMENNIVNVAGVC